MFFKSYQELISHLKTKVSIYDVVSKVVRLKRSSGSRFVGKCPFHNEKTGSFSINNTDGFYYCFGCLESGDVFSFIQKTQNITFKEAVEVLAKEQSIDTSSIARSNDGRSDIDKIAIESANEVMNKLRDISVKLLFSASGKIALDYLLNKRKFTIEAIKLFEFGLCPSLSLIKSDVCSKNTILEQCGIVVNNYCRFDGRIIVPIKNKSAKIIGFGGRIFTESQNSSDVAKYINSPETVLFRKGETVFNYDKVKQQKPSYVLVVEGYFDVIKLSQFGISALASMGTAITDVQISAILSLQTKVIFCFDNDKAGIKASERLIKMLFQTLTHYAEISFLFLPHGIKDPDEFLDKYGHEKFLHLVNTATKPVSLAIIDILLQIAIQNGTTKPDLSAIEYKIRAEIIPSITNQSLRSIYTKEIISEINKLRFVSTKKYKRKASPTVDVDSMMEYSKNKLQPLQKIEDNIVRLVINNIAFLKKFQMEIIEQMPIEFSNDKYNEIFNETFAVIESDNHDAKIILISKYHEYSDITFVQKNESDFILLYKKIYKEYRVLLLKVEMTKAILNDNFSLAKTLKREIENLRMTENDLIDLEIF